MAVKVSKSGGIYIEISGNYEQLEEDLKVVKEIAQSSGQAISDAMSSALNPKIASKFAESVADQG